MFFFRLFLAFLTTTMVVAAAAATINTHGKKNLAKIEENPFYVGNEKQSEHIVLLRFGHWGAEELNEEDPEYFIFFFFGKNQKKV